MLPTFPGKAKLPCFPPPLVRGSYRASHLSWLGEATVLPTFPGKANVPCFPPPLIRPSYRASHLPWSTYHNQSRRLSDYPGPWYKRPWTLVQTVSASMFRQQLQQPPCSDHCLDTIDVLLAKPLTVKGIVFTAAVAAISGPKCTDMVLCQTRDWLQ